MDEVRYHAPDLEEELVDGLNDVIEAKYYRGNNWNESILPNLLHRLDQLQQLASTKGEQFNIRPAGVDLKQYIVELNEKISSHLKRKFSTNPPFTILRIAEIVVNPSANGYELINNAKVLKYFNSLAKLILVSSNTTEYSPVSFNNHTDVDTSDPPPIIVSQSINVPLVEISWLKKTEVNPSDQEISLSPRRRREEDDVDLSDASDDAKRHKSDNDGKLTNGRGDSPSKIDDSPIVIDTAVEADSLQTTVESPTKAETDTTAELIDNLPKQTNADSSPINDLTSPLELDSSPKADSSPKSSSPSKSNELSILDAPVLEPPK